MASSLVALIGRILALPFALVGHLLSRLLRLQPGRGRLHLHGGDDDNDNDDNRVILDPSAAAQWFARFIKTADPGEAVDPSMWHLGSYSSALQLAKQDCLVLCVVLISKEHDDNAAFLRQTLCTPQFKRFQQEHRGEIMFWGGDVCTSRDAHVAATVLQAATFPLVAFLSMQPAAPSRLTGATPSPVSSKIMVFSRLEGLAASSIHHITQHVSETLGPRLNPFLGRLRAQKRERESQRMLREDQDRAYAAAGKKDLERVRAKEAELKAQKDAETQQKREADMKAREAKNRAAWRQKTATTFPKEAQQGTKVVARLPDGRRLMRSFEESQSSQRIWEWIDCEAFGFSTTSTGLLVAGSTERATPDSDYIPTFAFILATTFPRRTLKLTQVQNKTIGELVAEGLLEKKVTSVVVEGLSLGTESAAASDEEVEEESD